MMKIADFGLARDIHHIDYYKKTTNVSADEAPGCVSPAQGSPPVGCPRCEPGRAALPQTQRGGMSCTRGYLPQAPSLKYPPYPLVALPRATPNIPTLLAGPTACEVDGTRGPVRPDLHPPE